MFMNNKIILDGKRIITIVESGDTVISENNSEMDIRARCAVKSVIEKAEICKKPVARYDAVLKKHIWNLQTEKENMSERKLSSFLYDII